jgi:hypothetical protein
MARPTPRTEMEDIDDTVVISVLTNALTGYLKLLSLEQNLHESSQPRQGKGVETHSDLARTQYYHARTMAAESCQQLVERITLNVRRWINGREDVDNVRAESVESVGGGGRDEIRTDLNRDILSIPGFNFTDVRPEEEDEEPYINPMTGQWITPVSSKSAGPSRTQGQDEDLGGGGKEKSVDYGLDVSCVGVKTP